MDQSFASHEEKEVPQNVNKSKVEKMTTLVLNIYGATEVFRWKQKLDNIVKDLVSKGKGMKEALNNMNRLVNLEISRNSLSSALLSIYESAPVADKEGIVDFKRVMERTVEVLAVELERCQDKAAEVVLKDSPYAISWVAVMFVILIACLFVVVKVLFIVRICTLSHIKPASTGSSQYTQESFTVDLIRRMPIRCVTTSIAILGVLMFVLFICGAYNGFVMMLRGKSVPYEYQAFWTMNLSLVEDHRYDLSLSDFFEKCDKGSNLIDAFGTWRFLNSEFMEKLGLKLDNAQKSPAKPNLKKFTDYIEGLIKQVEVARSGYVSMRAKGELLSSNLGSNVRHCLSSNELAVGFALISSLCTDPLSVIKYPDAEGDFVRLSDALKKVKPFPISPSFELFLSTCFTFQMKTFREDDLQLLPEDVKAGRPNPTTRSIAEQALVRPLLLSSKSVAAAATLVFSDIQAFGAPANPPLSVNAGFQQVVLDGSGILAEAAEVYINPQTASETLCCFRCGGEQKSPTGLVWPTEARLKPWPSVTTDQTRCVACRCAFLGIFALSAFIAASLGATILDGIEVTIKGASNTATETKIQANSIPKSVTPKSKLEQIGGTAKSVTPTSKQERNEDEQEI
ncbi:hypothetical protein Y032_0047g1462 [Ancylostoma ceylanicum]|nr:hypothetical protein Y032_0047g1462 [Ancylostoma ceylanicum]